jgi:hypothetical protein
VRSAVPGALVALAILTTGGVASAETRSFAATSEAPPAADARHEDAEKGGLFGPVRIGAFGGVGFPRPLSIEGMIKVHDVVGIGLEYSLLPQMSIAGAELSFYAVNGDVRILPFGGAFFIGMAGGRQHLSASTSLSLPGSLGSTPEQVTADTWFINPRIGFLWTMDWGLTVGIDAGVQIPLSASVTNSIPSQLTASRSAGDAAHLFGESVLPTIDLLRLGMLF